MFAALALMLLHQNIFLLILGFDAILIGIFLFYVLVSTIKVSNLRRNALMEGRIIKMWVVVNKTPEPAFDGIDISNPTPVSSPNPPVNPLNTSNPILNPENFDLAA
eukprot:TRINITY_DN9164_c0_g1_i1.p1 TRINITY_DN9164_c0_g1~~TRINITY_DN9164_c0_g1_i1.p1  ORF type:complete len:106 (+),score=29.04 TRINITY_DN9164_c0_g1_i1:317-634(+)